MSAAERYEIHLTMLASAERVWAIRESEIARGVSLALTHIVLAHGAHPDQVLLTRRLSASRSTVLREAEALRERWASEVVRVKVERDLDGPVELDCGYYEHHVKLRVAPERLEQLAVLAREQRAHLSRNAFRAPDSLGEQRFLTQRFDRSAARAAARSLDALLAALAGVAEVIDVEREHVVYDSNLPLDAGWLEWG